MGGLKININFNILSLGCFFIEKIKLLKIKNKY